ncbi:WD40 repeat protein [Phaffia rhodozyma]|uniref:WD40 repeat protein n=1 Tax=Phaffia rhodozyma TaxID=264483 RepID=A0A0F7SHD7_PHARH|nr:WD40 repeat protein [Phaffia rhodozyma]
MASSSTAQYYVVNGAPGQSSIPAWLTQRSKNKKGAKRTKVQRTLGHVELIQHFEFPEASLKIRTTPDGHHAMATGVYKPQVRVYDLDQLTMKFERHTDQENVDFQILSQDWTKSIHLQSDRHIDLHTQGGLHHRTRIPHFGRALAYHASTCDALVGATGRSVYRLNLEKGSFLNPLEMQPGTDGVNAVDINPRHGLWAFGTERGAEGGCVEFFDPRARERIGILSLPSQQLRPLSSIGGQIVSEFDFTPLAVTSLASKSDGLNLAVGTSTGHTLLYDLRSPTAYAIKDQGYGLPVKKVQWLEGGNRVVKDGLIASADAKILKIWDRQDPATNFASLQPPTNLNDFHHLPGSGMIMVANEGVHMTTYYVPQLGPAPKWCSFLDNVTEEMEDHQGGGLSNYQDFKFIERSELATLGLDHLVGTPTLKPYMHGYFVSLKLYDAARLIANPFAYAEHREKVIREKLEKKSESRIRARREAVDVKVNKELAEKIKRDEETRRSKAKNGEQQDEGLEGPGESVLTDPRFAAVWSNPEFQVDMGSREYMLKNPVAAPVKAKTAVEEEEDESDRRSSDPDDESDEDSSEEDSDAEGALSTFDPRTQPKHENPMYRPSLRTQAGPKARLVTLSSSTSADPSPSSSRNKSTTFGQRIKAQAQSGSTSTSKGSTEKALPEGVLSHRTLSGGGMEMSFIPSSSSSSGPSKNGKKAAEGIIDDDFVDPGKAAREAAREKKRRGIEEFGAGMEKGGRSDEVALKEEERHGRQKRRTGGRNASGNVFRGLW